MIPYVLQFSLLPLSLIKLLCFWILVPHGVIKPDHVVWQTGRIHKVVSQGNCVLLVRELMRPAFWDENHIPRHDGGFQYSQFFQEWKLLKIRFKEVGVEVLRVHVPVVFVQLQNQQLQHTMGKNKHSVPWGTGPEYHLESTVGLFSLP